MTGEHGAHGSQGSADPPEHASERGIPHEMRRGSYNADAFVAEDNEATLRHRQLMGDTPGPSNVRQEARVGPDTQRRAADGAREPAPGEANPLAEHDGRHRDRRTSSLER